LGSGGFKGWLEAGGYTEAQYPTVADVLADENALRNLMTDNDACVAFVAWCNEENSMLAEFAESSIAMECIGASDYISNKLLAIPSASEQLLESEYWEYILKDKVPAMTSNTSPEGTVFCSSAHSSYPAYKAFNQTNVDNEDMWMATDNCAYPQYLGYAFTRPICVSKVLIANRNANNTINAVGTFKIQGSNKSDFSTIEFETEVMTHAGPTKALEEIYTVNSDKACMYWRICVLSCNEKILGLGENVAIGKLQFYGRLYSPESDNEDDVLTSADVVDNLLSDRADLPLSARMGSELNKKFATIGEHTLLASTSSTSETIFTVEDLKKFKYLLLTTTADVYRVNPTLIPVSLFKSSVNLEWQSGYNDGTKGWYVIAKYVSDTQVNLRVTGNGGHLYGVK
jgi:hypothetical protein